ncbi:MAG: hypothetical protein CVU65_10420 [Deltaproteobacteria bacterium HGW-Deltaproteobacteria-22]|nr:MAG: hypothetical protein CVU65_10420 [Deltaproteobacteria bacterium HGW-Deltaproteobacteria-22]
MRSPLLPSLLLFGFLVFACDSPHHRTNDADIPDADVPEVDADVPDDGDGSGPAMTEYRLNGGAWAMGSSTVVAPGTHTLGWRSRDLAGNIESEQTTSVTVLKAPMSVSLTSKSATISYGASYVLSGRLTSDGVPQTSMRVVVQYLSAGVWKDTSVSAYTDVNGNYRATIKYSSKHTYRVSFPADAYHLGATSTSIVVTPRAYVGTPKAPTTMSRTKYYTVYGYLKPRHTQGTYPVRIYKWRKTASGSWKSEGYVKAKATNYYSYSKCNTNDQQSSL